MSEHIESGEESTGATERNPQAVRRQVLFEHLPDPVFVHDTGGNIVDINAAAIETTGYSREQLLEMSVTDIEVGVEAGRLRSAWDEETSGEPIIFEGEHKRADGSTHPVEVWVCGIETSDDRWMVAVARDITDQKEREREIQRQRDNLEILNEVVRHDIRNDLQLVNAYAELLGEYVGEDGQQHLQKVTTAAQRAVDLTQTARDLSEVMLEGEISNDRIHLGRTLDNQVEEVRSAHPGSAIIVENTLPDVSVTGTEMLDSVFRNLLKNAIQHNDKDVAEVTVSATVSEDWATVRVADNGPGVPDEQKEEIFGKGEKGLQSAGTGLGLYLVQSLVDGYGGEVWVEDNEPRGAVFAVKLPVAE